MNPIDTIAGFLAELKTQGRLAPVCLSTIGPDGTPNSRFVDLKEVLEGALLFGTDDRSVKAQEFALSCWWDSIQTQIRVRGTADRAPVDVSDRLFAQRGETAKALASVSVQSAELPDLEMFRREVARFLETSGVIPRPAIWHVYAVVPREIEILHFSEDRIHRRTRFVKEAGKWAAMALYP